MPKPEDPTPERYITRAEALEIVGKLEQLPANELEQLDRMWQAANCLVMLAAAAKLATPNEKSMIKTEEDKQKVIQSMTDGIADFFNLKMSDAHKALGAAKLMLAHWKMNVDDCAQQLKLMQSIPNN